MKNLLKIVDSIKGKFLKPRVYAMLLKSKQGGFLVLESAYNLEDAYAQGKLNFKKNHPEWDMSEIKIDMFTHSEYTELLQPVVSNEEVVAVKEIDMPDDVEVIELTFKVPKNFKEDKALDKNTLMAEIVSTKGVELLEKNKEKFSETEYKYLLGKIKKNAKN